MCYIQVKNIRFNSFYEEKKIKLCLTKQLLNMFKLWCEWGIRKDLFFILYHTRENKVCCASAAANHHVIRITRPMT